MADYLELANSYYRLLHWIESSDADKKNTALRSLDRIKHFLTESNVEVLDLTGQPYSEGWAIKVLKMDDSVPEKDLVFTKMVKPIIQINGDLMQEGEVYVGRLEIEDKVNILQDSEVAEQKIESVNENESNDTIPEEQNANKKSLAEWFKNTIGKIKSLNIVTHRFVQWTCGIMALIVVIILVTCTLARQTDIRTDVAAIDKKVEELKLVDYRNQLGDTSIVTYEVHNGDNTIVVTQPVGEVVASTVEINGIPITITTSINNTITAEGE